MRIHRIEGQTDRKTPPGDTKAALRAHAQTGDLLQLARERPDLLQPGQVAQLHRQFGNRALARLLQREPLVLQRAVSKDLEPVLEQMKLDLKGAESDSLLEKLLTEVIEQAEAKHVLAEMGPSSYESEATVDYTGKGQHKALIDPEHWTKTQLPTILLHELVHTLVAEKFATNKKKKGGLPENIIEGDELEKADSPGNQFVYIQGWLNYLREQVLPSEAEKLRELGVETVPSKKEDVVGYLERRLFYAAYNANTEFDTIISELYYFSNKIKMPKELETYKLLEKLAQAAYDARNKGIPVTQSMGEPPKVETVIEIEPLVDEEPPTLNTAQRYLNALMGLPGALLRIPGQLLNGFLSFFR